MRSSLVTMQKLCACSVRAMAQHIDVCDRGLRKVSAHHALLFRERMYTVLSAAPRLRAENGNSGILETETVWEIQKAAIEIITTLRLDIDFNKNAPFLRLSRTA